MTITTQPLDVREFLYSQTPLDCIDAQFLSVSIAGGKWQDWKTRQTRSQPFARLSSPLFE